MVLGRGRELRRAHSEFVLDELLPSGFLFDFDFEFIEAAAFSEQSGGGSFVFIRSGGVSKDEELGAFNSAGDSFIGSLFSDLNGSEPVLGSRFISPFGRIITSGASDSGVGIRQGLVTGNEAHSDLEVAEGSKGCVFIIVEEGSHFLLRRYLFWSRCFASSHRDRVNEWNKVVELGRRKFSNKNKGVIMALWQE